MHFVNVQHAKVTLESSQVIQLMMFHARSQTTQAKNTLRFDKSHFEILNFLKTLF